jgi:hypothetical protein
MFYHNPSRSIEELLQTKSWYRPIKTPIESFRKVSDVFACALLALHRASQEQSVTIPLRVLGASQHSPFLSVGFPNFIKDLLICTFPTLRNRLFRRSGLLSGSNLHQFIWGDCRDLSVPTILATLERSHPAYIRLTVNERWADDRRGDLFACVGSGNLALAMSLHPRLGRDSWLGKLTSESLRVVVSFLS